MNMELESMDTVKVVQSREQLEITYLFCSLKYFNGTDKLHNTYDVATHNALFLKHIYPEIDNWVLLLVVKRAGWTMKLFKQRRTNRDRVKVSSASNKFVESIRTGRYSPHM